MIFLNLQTKLGGEAEAIYFNINHTLNVSQQLFDLHNNNDLTL